MKDNSVRSLACIDKEDLRNGPICSALENGKVVMISCDNLHGFRSYARRKLWRTRNAYFLNDFFVSVAFYPEDTNYEKPYYRYVMFTDGEVHFKIVDDDVRPVGNYFELELKVTSPYKPDSDGEPETPSGVISGRGTRVERLNGEVISCDSVLIMPYKDYNETLNNTILTMSDSEFDALFCK